MTVRNLAELSWNAVAAADLRRTVAVLPVGALEAHGPHLPLATDVIIAEAMARSGARLISEAGHDALLLPALAYTPARFSAGFAGTISIASATLTSLVSEIGYALRTHGVRHLAIANSHLDPAHLKGLHEAVAQLRQEGLTVTFPDITRRRLAERLTDEFRSGACHGGCYETSIVLAERPDLVDDAVRATLPPVPHSLSAAIRAGLHTFEEVGGEQAYFGDPAAASRDEGAATVAELGRILAEAVLAAVPVEPKRAEPSYD